MAFSHGPRDCVGDTADSHCFYVGAEKQGDTKTMRPAGIETQHNVVRRIGAQAYTYVFVPLGSFCSTIAAYRADPYGIASSLKS